MTQEEKDRISNRTSDDGTTYAADDHQVHGKSISRLYHCIDGILVTEETSLIEGERQPLLKSSGEHGYSTLETEKKLQKAKVQ